MCDNAALHARTVLLRVTSIFVAERRLYVEPL